MTASQLLETVTASYRDSHDANGLPVYALIETEEVDASEVSNLIAEFVDRGEIEVVWSETDLNPHIRRLPRKYRLPFPEAAARFDLTQACLYPMEDVIASEIDLTKWKRQPYTHRLWAGGAHMDLVFFDLEVLERYRNDPRFRYEQTYFGGSIGLKNKHAEDETFPERDQVFIQQFGIGYDAQGHRVLSVILSDLRGLTNEHQNIWRGFEREDPCKLNEASFDAWYKGEWSEFGSVYEALTEELRIVNEMTARAFGKKLFKSEFATPPDAYGVLLRPTYREYMDFARALDLMLSENIDTRFFPDSIERHSLRTDKEGAVHRENKGSIQLLGEWIRSAISSAEGKPDEEISSGMKAVRKVRSKASHTDGENEYDHKYETAQNDLLLEAYKSLRILRLVIANHPAARIVEVPDWLFKGDIRFP
jgi:hypothetical protein